MFIFFGLLLFLFLLCFFLFQEKRKPRDLSLCLCRVTALLFRYFSFCLSACFEKDMSSARFEETTENRYTFRSMQDEIQSLRSAMNTMSNFVGSELDAVRREMQKEMESSRREWNGELESVREQTKRLARVVRTTREETTEWMRQYTETLKEISRRLDEHGVQKALPVSLSFFFHFILSFVWTCKWYESWEGYWSIQYGWGKETDAVGLVSYHVFFLCPLPLSPFCFCLDHCYRMK